MGIAKTRIQKREIKLHMLKIHATAFQIPNAKLLSRNSYRVWRFVAKPVLFTALPQDAA